ncbi:MAG TPA: uroporphyrinogen-III synthase [Xanthobacteraceae bacterium]|nr:uroporphyrinogen-III synthase [Xanthobacteraceae bacterium]
MRLLVTRPEPDAARTATALQNRGHQVLLAPLLRMQPTEARFGLGPFAGVLATSANALRAIAAHRKREELLGLVLVTVGQRTAQAGREIGFRDVRSADGDARDLVALAAAVFRGTTRPLLYLAGEDQAADLSGLLGARGFKVRTAITYKAEAVKAFPDSALAALAEERVDGVLHYSRRTAETYVQCADAADIRRAAMAPVHYCLSREIAAALQAGGARSLRVAERPDEPALFRLLEA